MWSVGREAEHPERFRIAPGDSGPGGLAAGLSSPLARSHNERPLSAAICSQLGHALLAMRAAHSMVPAATFRPDE